MIKKGLSVREIASLIEYLETSSTHHSMLIELLALTGMRTHELWGLKVNDLDLANKTLTIWDAAKGSNGRVVGLPSGFVSRVRGKVLGKDGESKLIEALGYDLRGGKIQSFKATLRHDWQVIKRRVFGGKLKLGLHALRHTFALTAYRASNDPLLVKNLLGHRSYSSTEKYLVYVNEDKQINVSRGLYEKKAV